MKKIVLILIIIIPSPIFWIGLWAKGFAQNTDSLWKVYNDKNQVDTTRLSALHAIGKSYVSNKPDTAIVFGELELKLANTLPANRAKYWVADAYNLIGIANSYKGNYQKALDYYIETLPLYKELNNKSGIAFCYNNMGVVYQYQADYPKALDNYLKALQLREELGDKQGQGNCYSNIGLIYWYQSNYPKALECHFKALKLLEGINDKKSMANCYSNIGAVYENQANYSKTLEYDRKALKIYQELDNKRGMATSLGNMGNVYKNLNDYHKALDHYIKSLQLRKVIGDKEGEGICYGNMGDLYNRLADYKLAIQYCDSELILCKAIGDIEGVREAISYSKTNKYKDAYEYHVKFKTLTDSIFNADNSKQLGDMKTKFEVDKKEAELKIKSEAEQEKLKAIAGEEKKRQQVIIAAVAGVLLLVLCFSLFLYKRFKITERQKTIIENQKKMVDEAYEHLHEKNKEVMDSIRYAKRIQTALITSEKYITNSLNRLMKN